MTGTGKLRLFSGIANGFRLPVYEGFMRLDVSRLQIASGGRRGTRMWHQFRACCFGLGQAVSTDFVTRLGVSRLLATSARHLGTSVPPHWGFRRILGLGPAVSSRFAVRLLFR